MECKPGQVVLCENVRFFKGEKKNSEELAAKYAAMGDIYVMDAFGAAHRAQASTEGALRKAAVAVAGPLMFAEMEAATKLLDTPERPLFAIIGGSKVSTKLTVLENLLKHVDGLIVGGGIANTFLEAAGYNMGSSLVEKDLIPEAKRLIDMAKERNVLLPLPTDVVVAPSFERASEAVTKKVSELSAEDCAFDIGEETVKAYAKILADARTIVWNGPVARLKPCPSTRAVALLPTSLPTPRPTPWCAAAIPWPLWNPSAWPPRWAICPPAAARSSKCSKARPCPPWPPLPTPPRRSRRILQQFAGRNALRDA